MQSPPSPAPHRPEAGWGVRSTEQPPTLPTLPTFPTLTTDAEQGRRPSSTLRCSASYPERLAAAVVVVAAVDPPQAQSEAPLTIPAPNPYPSSPPPSYAEATQQQQLPPWVSPESSLPYHTPPGQISGPSHQFNGNATTRDFTNYYAALTEAPPNRSPPPNPDRIVPQRNQPVISTTQRNNTNSPKGMGKCYGGVGFLLIVFVVFVIIIAY